MFASNVNITLYQLHPEEASSMAGVKFEKLRRLFILILLLFIYNEFVVYYIVLSLCDWPTIKTEVGITNKIKVMILADVHLLGSREGHWFDKLRREWQMERSFQTAMMVHHPDVVFILGDLFDEGKWCSDAEFEYHVDRFYRKFSTPSSTQLFVVAGNHDMGFHYMIDDHKRMRFAQHLSAPSVRMVNVSGNVFVLLNSMAFEGDRCSMCKEAEEQLEVVHQNLLCAKGLNASCPRSPVRFSDPILLQHFPLYRPSDSNCTGLDSAPEDEKFVHMRSKWDCLDKDISKELLMKLKPRVVFSGHTHHFCVTHHGSIPEWNVPSFSWRYKKLSSFIMMSLTPTSFEISKCYLPHETTVIYTYLIGLPAIIIITLFPIHLLKIKPRTKTI